MSDPIGVPMDFESESQSSIEAQANVEFESQENKEEKIVGYLINFGITSWRLFEVPHDTKKELKEIKAEAYQVSNPHKDEYLPGIISSAKTILNEIHTMYGTQLFIKVFADHTFYNIFQSEKQISDFTQQFYKETRLCFNIISQKQTEENLNVLFGDIKEKTAIINIGSLGVDVYIISNHTVTMHNVPIGLTDVEDFIARKKIQEKWTDANIDLIKNFIKQHFPTELNKINAKRAIIIKGEYSFMKNIGYVLYRYNGRHRISMENYKIGNRQFVFQTDFMEKIKKIKRDPAEIRREYGFKYGHIIIELILEKLGVDWIYPNDKLSIHGNINAYIFNVVVSGSMKGKHRENLQEACRLMESMGASVLSPVIANGEFVNRTSQTDYEHACAIRECDMLFVSNKDGYFGESTKQQIYGAFLLKKPIAFWKEPTEAVLQRLTYIPHEQWQGFMDALESNS